MPDARPLRVVTVRELSRKPSLVLQRVAQGERFIVCRHGRPVATLQPLDVLVDPIRRNRSDVAGTRIEDLDSEADNLTEVQQGLLARGVHHDRIVPMRLAHDYDLGVVVKALDGLGIRGLARKTHRGWVLTGRGMILHERLRAGDCTDEPGRWRLRDGTVEA